MTLENLIYKRLTQLLSEGRIKATEYLYDFRTKKNCSNLLHTEEGKIGWVQNRRGSKHSSSVIQAEGSLLKLQFPRRSIGLYLCLGKYN